jgi:type III pantothenate kinase
MLLAIDSGNTNVVFAIYEGKQQRGRWRASSDARRTTDEYAVWLTQLMALEDLTPAQVDGAILANVVPAASYPLETLCRRYFKAEPMIVGASGVDLGIEVRTASAANVGADRLVNAVAAHRAYGGPLIVIDFGTATTFDVVAAALLPRVPVERPASVIGKDTVPAMKSGIYWGYVGLIEGLVSRIKAEYGGAMRVVATGGLAPIYADACDVIDQVDPDLTLRGLALIHEANRGGAA